MRIFSSNATAHLRRAPLSTCLAAAWALGALTPAVAVPASAPWPSPQLQRGHDDPLLERLRARAAATRSLGSPPRPDGGLVLPVTSCADDGGTGTLRHVVLTASSGDTVDLSALTCSTITLQSGAVNVDVDDLTIAGPGAQALTIDGDNAGRVFRHGGAGTLYLTDLTVAHGNYTNLTTAYGGGCIYTTGSLSLDGVVVASCTTTGGTGIVGGAILSLHSVVMFYSTVKDSRLIASIGDTNTAAEGGGVVSVAQLVLEHSTISGNSVTTPLGNVYGGGAFAVGNFTAKYSTVHGNVATTTNAPGSIYAGIAGGLDAKGAVFIQNTTFDGNSADGGGAIFLRNAPYATTIRNSTISGNQVSLIAGGIYVNSDLTLQNSTIAFNVAGSFGGGGLIVGGPTADLESTIIADNTPNGTQAAADFDGSATVTGANNLIKISGVPVPPDTITQDPQLGPLAYNGGETRTHAITAASPAFDTGNNVAGSTFDQRGPSFPRVVGDAPDIGAYELNPDVIFLDGFE